MAKGAELMANTPPNGTIIGAGAPVGSGYPLFVSQDSSGTLVTPQGQYVWNPNAGASGLWIPAPVDANGNPQVTLTGNGSLPPQYFLGATLVTSGTVAVSTQNPSTSQINEPAQKFQRYLLAFYNTTGQTISSVTVNSVSASINGTNYNTVEIAGVNVSSGGNSSAGTVYWHPNNSPYLFTLGPIKFTFNLSASGSGNIAYSLYGYS
jgi:hypothetical protein